MAININDIRALEKRMQELEPSVKEYRMCRSRLTSIRRAIAGPGARVTYNSLEDRQKQVQKLLAKDPKMTNQAIADEIGVTAARVSQIKSSMKA